MKQRNSYVGCRALVFEGKNKGKITPLIISNNNAKITFETYFELDRTDKITILEPKINLVNK